MRVPAERRSVRRRDSLYQRVQTLLAWVALCGSCQRSGAEIHLIPAAFRGSVVIVYACGSAGSLPTENGARVYRIPDSGILITSDQHREGWRSAKYFHASASGARAPVDRLDSNSTGLGVTFPETVVWYEGPMDVQESQSNRTAERYFVGDSEDRSNWFELSERQFKRAQELVKLTCPPAA